MKRFGSKLGGVVRDEEDDLGIFDAPILDPAAAREATREAFAAPSPNEPDDAPIVLDEVRLERPRHGFASGGAFESPRRNAPFRAANAADTRAIDRTRPPMPTASAAPVAPVPPAGSPPPQRSPFALLPTAEDEQDLPRYLADRNVAQENPWDPPVRAAQPENNEQQMAAVDPAPANNDDDGPIVPTANGGTRPEAAPMLVPDARTKKLSSGDGAYGANEDERRQLEEARHGDERQDRRGRIARGVFAGLGLLGAATGLNGLAGIGAAGLGVTNAAMPEANRRQRSVQEQIAERVGRVNAERTANDRERAATSEAEAQRVAAERQARIDDANIGLTQARTQAATADAENDAFERASAAGDAAGMRAALRATVNGLNDESGLVQQWRALVASPDFDGMSGESLRSFSGQVAQLANNRRAGVLEGGGGHGGGGTTTSVWDAATGRFVDTTTGGGRRRPAAQPLPPTPGDTAPVATPTPGGTRHGRPPANPAPAPPADPNAPQPVALPSEDEQLLIATRAEGIDPNTPEGLAYITSLRAASHSRDAAEARAARETIRTALHANATVGNLPVGIPTREWERLTHEAAPHAEAFVNLSPLTHLLRRGGDDTVIRAALYGGPEMARVAGASELRSTISRYFNTYYHDFGGANITAEEKERYMRAFASDSIAIDPQQFVRAINSAQRINAEQARAIINRLTRGREVGWEHYANTVLHPPRRR